MIVRVADGLSFAARVRGRGTPVLFLHGFTGSGREWDVLAAALGDGLRTIAVDLIGHGESDAPREAERYALPRASADLSAVLDAVAVARALVVGYSLGGRVALRFALDAPDRVAGLVVVSASAGIADPAARAARRAADLALADRIEREGTRPFVDEWQRSELFAGERALPAARRHAVRRARLAQRPHGLANSLRGMGQGAMDPLWDRLGSIGAPTLVVTGALDRRYRDIGRRLSERIGGARHVAVAEAGHGVHRERPAELAGLIRSFARGRDATDPISTREVAM